jgi:hypothetical protein
MKFIRDLAYACLAGHLLGRAIGLLFRRHREQKQACTAHQPSCRREHAELTVRWQDKRPNSIG